MKGQLSGQRNKAQTQPRPLAAELVPAGGAVTLPPLFSLRRKVIERKGGPRRGGPEPLPGWLEDNLKGTGLSSRFSYGNAVVEEEGSGGGQSFSFFG